ncbi:MAG: hypothetical protein V1799_17350 [bacterium]
MINRILLACSIIIGSASCSDIGYCQDELRIWHEFITALRSGTMSIDRIHPYNQLGDFFKPTLLGYLDSVRTLATASDWAAIPKVIQFDNRTQYIIPWTTGNQKVSYCFSFITENTQWYFQHLEAVFLRLDTLPPPPVSDFPDIADQQKNWMREEIYWSFIVTNFYLPIVKEKGKEYALNLLKDGGGYYLAAKAWVPFTSSQKAFILYLCWEQAKLRGNDVTLAKLEDDEAIVMMNSQFLSLYFTVLHLKPIISLEEYRGIFETIWRDRATKAGWSIDILYADNYKVTFHLKRRE